jgi:GNAT superfamily N-acetyltransferase
VERHEVWVLVLDGTVVGWHRVRRDGDRAELEDLWLEPAHIGAGFGRRLFEHAAQIARDVGAEAMEWDAEPYALGFYEAMGGVIIGDTPSAAEPGRMLPRMRLELRLRGTPQRGGA